jgi:hypothetical protein
MTEIKALHDSHLGQAAEGRGREGQLRRIDSAVPTVAKARGL